MAIILSIGLESKADSRVSRASTETKHVFSSHIEASKIVDSVQFANVMTNALVIPAMRAHTYLLIYRY